MMLRKLRRRLAFVFTAFTGAVLAAVLGVNLYSSIQQTIYSNEMWFSTTANQVVSTIISGAANGEMPSIDPGGYIVYVSEDGQEVPGLVLSAQSGETGAAPALSDARREELFRQAKTIAEEEGYANWNLESYYLSEALVGITIEDNAAVAFEVEATQPTAGVASEQTATAVAPVEDTAAANAATAGDTSEGAWAGVDAGEAAPSPLVGAFEQGSVAISIGQAGNSEGVFNLEYEGARYRAAYLQWNFEEEQGKTAHYELALLEDLSGQTGQIFAIVAQGVLLLLGGLALLFLANWFLAKLVLRPTEEGMQRQTEFVAAASHELRGPLAVITSSLSAAEGAEEENEATRYRAAAADEAARMAHLVDDLLLLAGGDAGSWKLNRRTVDLDAVLIDASEGYRPLAKTKGVALALELPEETLPQVPGDAERVRQILAVLLDNALQYAPAGSAVTLSARAKKGAVAISVADHGPGIPDDKKQQVFGRFYRADPGRSDKGHFGLGLSVAKELAELHGGSLAAKDTEGGGATFVVTLPVK